MPIKRITQPTVSAVGTVSQRVSMRYDSTIAMGEVVIGAGAGTSSVQFQGSNDDTNWTNIGSAITATTRNVALNPNNEVWQFYRASTTIATATKDTTITFYFS